MSMTVATDKQVKNIEFILPYDAESCVDEYVQNLQKKFPFVEMSYEIYPIENTHKFKLIVSVNVPIIKHDGYTYVATLKSVALDNNSREVVVYGSKENLSEYYSLEFRCDHCHTNHIRYTVHVFENENGERKIIGSSCAKAYFGIDIAQSLNKLLNFYSVDLSDEIEENFCSNFRSLSSSFDKEEFAKVVRGVIKHDGKYISRSNSEYSDAIPTSSNAILCLKNPAYKTKEEKEYDEKIFSAGSDLDYSKVVEYWDEKEETNNFIHNVKISLKMQQPKEGFIAYAVWEYMREVEDFTGKKKLNEISKNSEYFGEIKQRLTVNAEVVKLIERETQYGMSTIVKLISDDANVITWFASRIFSDDELKEGMKVKLTGTVKGHNEYKGVKSTILTRCKF